MVFNNRRRHLRRIVARASDARAAVSGQASDAERRRSIQAKLKELADKRAGRKGYRLKDALVQEGAIFQTTTDSEVVVHLFARSKEPTTEAAVIDALAQVRGAAAPLPDAPFALNLCEDRHRFLVAFCAVALRGQTTLLPPARTRGATDDVRARDPHSY